MFVYSRVTGATPLSRSWEFPVHFAEVTLKTRPSDDVDDDDDHHGANMKIHPYLKMNLNIMNVMIRKVTETLMNHGMNVMVIAMISI